MTIQPLIAATTNWQLERMFIPHLNRTMLVQQLLQPVIRESVIVEQRLQNHAFLQLVHINRNVEQHSIYYEDFDGVPLRTVNSDTLTVEQIMKIAYSLAQACHALHQEGLIFKQLNTEHILVNEKTYQVKLIPSVAIMAPNDVVQHEHSLQLLQTIAPEQTGRIQLQHDERTDLYAFGALIFCLIESTLFEATQKEELLFQIVTKTPAIEKIAARDGYSQFAAILAKLLMKNPNDRYQSSIALKHDIALLMNGELKQLAYGDKLFTPQACKELCGRQAEMEQLVCAFQNVMDGSKQLIFLKGAAGIGKSVLLQQLKPSVSAAEGFFIDYKFEQRHQHELEAIVIPIRQLLKQLYFKGDRAIQQFQEAIDKLDVMLTESLLQLLPELRVLLHKTVTIAEDAVDFTKQQNTYLFLAIKQLLQAVTATKTPIIFSVEDCQWASNKALDHILRIFEQHESGYFGIVMTARNEQQTYAETLICQQQAVTIITVSTLQLADVQHWLKQSIVLEEDALQKVAQQLYEHTEGNPLFLKEVFQALLKNNAFIFQEQQYVWTMNEPLFLQVVEQNDLVDFIIERIQYVSLQAQQILKIAAAIGYVFPQMILEHLVDCSDEELQQCLQELIVAGFIVESVNSYRGLGGTCYQFVHDRIHETAYKLLLQIEKQHTHYAIANILVQQQKQELLLPVVEQYSLSGSLVTDDQKQLLRKWNYELGLQSKNAGLYDEALQFFLTSESLIPQQQSQSLQRELTNLYMYIGECSFLAGQYEQSERYIQQALLYATTSIEKLKIYRIMTFLYFESQNGDVVLQAGYLAFQECGIKLPKNPQKQHVLQEYVKLKWALKNKSNDQLLQLPSMESEEMDLLLQIIVNIISSSFRMDSNLTGLLLLRSMRIMLRYGVIAESAIVFVNYAIVLAAGFNDIKAASRFGRLAVELANKQKNKYIHMRVYFAYGTFIHYWENDYEGSKQYLHLSQRLAVQCGLPSIANAASCFIVALQLLQGKPLQTLSETIDHEQRQYKEPIVLAKDYLQECRNWVQSLQQNLEPDWQYDYTLKNEHAVVVMHHILRLQMSFLWQQEEEAIVNLQTLQVATRESLNLMTAPLYNLYRSLWQFDWLMNAQLDNALKKQYMADIEKSLHTFKKWVTVSPQNFEHLYMLLKAEKCSLQRSQQEACMYYERAIHVAKTRGFLLDFAIANKRYADFLQRKNDVVKVEQFITEAIQAMNSWGATAIANKWQSVHSSIVEESVIAKQGELLNLTTVVETTQALTKEIRMEDLVEQLLRTLQKHCHATACYFIQLDGERLHYTAKIEAERLKFTYAPTGELLAPAIEMIANFVLQYEEALLIPNVEQHALFSKDIDDIKSILCLPIHHNGRLLAMLYLEHRELENAFNSEQLQLIQLVTTQIAISLENAGIYENLEMRVEERTKQYEEMAAYLMLANNELEQKEQERKKLFATISQQLRQPLMTSLTHLDIALQNYLQPSVHSQQHLIQSKKQLLYMNTLINDVMDFVKLEAGNYEYKLEVVSVHQLFTCIVESFTPQLEALNIKLDADCLVDDGNLVLVDQKAVLQVAANMFAHTLQLANREQLTLRFTQKGKQLVCTVDYTSRFVHEDQMAPLMTVFNFHYHSVATIGLAVCHEIMNKHNGQLQLSSTLIEGTSSNFTLPLL